MLKLEPGEARNVVLAPDVVIPQSDAALMDEGVEVMRRWRHVA